MEKCDDKSLTSNNHNNNNTPRNTEKCEIIPIEGHDKDKIWKSQLLSSDGWKNYQKGLIRSCFELWEVNETQQFQVNNRCLKLDLPNVSEIQTIQTPLSLFENENNEEIVIDLNSNRTLNNATNSESLRKKEEYVNIIDQPSKSKHGNKGNKENKRIQKLKKFSFCKHTRKQTKSNEKVQCLSFDRYASYSSDDVWAYTIWSESVEKMKGHKLRINKTKGNIENNNSNGVKCDITNNDDTTYYLDIEAEQMEQKVRKLIKSLKEKNKSCANIDANERASKCRSSRSRLKYFFKSAFRGNQNHEFDRQLLDDYTKYINRKLHTWETLLHCLNDIRQREQCCSTNACSNHSEDTIKYRFSEHGRNEKAMDDCDGDDNFKCVEINDGFGGTAGKLKNNKFFRLLGRTKSTMDMRATVKLPKQNGAADCSIRGVNLRWPSYQQIDEHFDVCKLLGTNCCSGRDLRPGRIRKSLSDSDLPTSGSRTADYDGRPPYGYKATRISDGRRALTPEMLMVHDEDTRHWQDMARGLWEEQHEAFQTVMARLEYVGSTFPEQSRLAGLKTLCKVDVLAGLGRSSEAVDLFVSTLPLSNDPDLMIRKAKAAYDWKFYCHLSVWRHSYKD